MSTFNANGKRNRLDEDDETFFDSPLPKKTFDASLPFRTSPTTKHIRLFSQSRRLTPQPLLTQPLTPTDSEDEISPCCPTNAPPASVASPAQKPQDDPADVEMALGSPKQICVARTLDFDSMMLSPKASPFTVLSPGPSQTRHAENANTGRVPTPIYGHFQKPPTESKSADIQLLPPAAIESEYEKHMRARRLPTPISEDEAMETFDEAEDDFGLIDSTQMRQPARFPPPAASHSMKRVGKPLFSMGFRADCALCQSRVPGHYNHIFWT